MPKLAKEDFDRALGSETPGTKVRLTFRREATHDRADLYYLIGMDGKIIQMPQASRMILQAVAQSGQWCGDENRTYTVELLPGFDREWFEDRLRRPLEKIEVVAV